MSDSEQDILEEIAADQRIVPFMGDDLIAAMTPTQVIFISLNGMCQALGIAPKGQAQRILRTSTLANGLRRIPLKTSGGTQRVNCLRVDKVALWLAGIETSRIKPAFRGKIEAYQEELAPVAMRVFMRVLGMTPAPALDQRLTALAEHADLLLDVALFLYQHQAVIEQLPGMGLRLDEAVALMQALADQQAGTHAAVQDLQDRLGLTPLQKQHVAEAVSRIVKDSAGKPGTLTHAQVYAALRRRFQVSAYDDIAARQYDEVIHYLRDLWKRATSGHVPEQGNLF